ncbi:hypothetical protein DMUE_2930 [Dictyocoela muelleri]|nr:hypothetical protein DMUE_2930 [Dictyocoela muelleri]
MSSFTNLEKAYTTEMSRYNEDKETITQRNCAIFEYVSNLSGLRIQHKIENLENIHEQDISKCSVQFTEIKSMCNRSEEGRLQVLSHVINPEIRRKVFYTGNTAGLLESLLRLSYNSSQAHQF